MSANDHSPTIDPNGQTAGTLVRHDEPEPDITSAGANLVRALVILSAFVFIAWAAMANLYQVTIARETVARATAQDFAPASRARAADVARAQNGAEVTLEEGKTQSFAPVAEAAGRLLNNASALGGKAQYARVEGTSAVVLPALPSLEAVLNPAAAQAAEEAAPAAEEAPAQEAAAEEAPAEAAAE